jgi:hypothetical protein
MQLFHVLDQRLPQLETARTVVLEEIRKLGVVPVEGSLVLAYPVLVDMSESRSLAWVEQGGSFSRFTLNATNMTVTDLTSRKRQRRMSNKKD